MSEYIGKRIVPKHCGEWNSGTAYEVLSIVLDKSTGDSYISKKEVPAGTELTDTEYWALCSQFSSQIEKIKNGLTDAEKDIDLLNTRLDANVTASTDADADYAAEVVDARVDGEGNSHTSLGDHIRDAEKKKLDRAYDATGEVTKGIAVNTLTGETPGFTNAYTTDFIPVNRDIQTVYYTGTIFNWIGVAGYNRNGNFVCSIFDLTEDGSTKAYTEEILTIPEGVTQIRASSYNNSNLSIKIVTEAEPFWEQIGKTRERLADTEKDIDVLYNADALIAEEAMNLRDLAMNYSGIKSWITSSPYLSAFYVPLTIFKDVYIESIRWRQTFIGDASVTVTLELDGSVAYSETKDVAESTESEICITPKCVIKAGAYILRLRATDAVMCYPSRDSSLGFVSNDYISNEPSGDVVYSHSNNRIVFIGTVAIRTGGVDDSLSLVGIPADAAAAGKADRKKLDKVMGRNLLDPAAYRPGWFAYTNSSSVTFHEDNLRYGSSDYIPVSENGLITSGSGTNGVTSQVVYDAEYNPLRHVDANDQYSYEDGDAYVVFCYHASSGETLCVLDGTEYSFEEYTDYLPLAELEGRVEDLEGKADNAEIKLNVFAESDTFLMENALTPIEVPMYYSGTKVWRNTSPLLANYWTPLTVLKGVYIESISWSQRFYGADTMTVTLEDADGNIFFSETVPIDVTVNEENTYEEIDITVTPRVFIPAGAYLIRYRTVNKVQCYTTKTASEEYVTNEYFNGEATGGITYLYNNDVLVFKGTICVMTSYAGFSDEVKDARMDYNGNTYDSLGEHIRVVTQKKMDTVYDATGEVTAGISVNTQTGNIVNFSAGYTTDFIPVSRESQKVYYTGRIFNWVGVTGYDTEGKFICSILDTVSTNTAVIYENEELVIPEGVYQIRASSYTYAPVITIEGKTSGLWSTALESKMRLDVMDGVNKTEIGISTPMPIYTVCNDLNTERNYYASVWIDHLIQKKGWKDINSGFGEEMDGQSNFYSPFSNENANGGEDVLEQAVTKEFVSEGFQTQKISFTHRSTLASKGKDSFPKILTIGDSVTVGYLANANKDDSSLPNPYWAWVKYLFELDRADAGGEGFNCLMVGVPSIGGISYGTSSAFTLNGTRYNNYAVGKGGWSAEDLNLETFESNTNGNPFYDSGTGAFSLKAFLDNFRTLDDDGVTRLVVGETAGAKVTDASAYDLCTPTHVVINLNHNSSLAEYQATIPVIVETIKREYPDMVIILMSIDETGTYFPAKYPQYSPDNITIGSLHEKNVSIYEYFCQELQDESRDIYVCSGHLVQPPVESYPTFIYTSADSIGRDAEHTLGQFHGFGKGYGGPNWHPNNYAHAAWGYQLYALIKYTLALKESE